MLTKILFSIIFLSSILVNVNANIAAVGRDVKEPAKSALSHDEEGIRYFTDLKVITHEGKEVRFYSDLLKDKVVLIQFFYTNCPTAPPEMAQLFKLQKILGDQLGREIYILSVSVDPERDTLEAVQEYARKFNPRKGWFFLTGKKENMEMINRKLGNRSADPESHIQIFFLGNLKTKHWMRMPPNANAFSLAEGLRHLASENEKSN